MSTEAPSTASFAKQALEVSLSDMSYLFVKSVGVGSAPFFLRIPTEHYSKEKNYSYRPLISYCSKIYHFGVEFI